MAQRALHLGLLAERWASSAEPNVRLHLIFFLVGSPVQRTASSPLCLVRRVSFHYTPKETLACRNLFRLRHARLSPVSRAVSLACHTRAPPSHVPCLRCECPYSLCLLCLLIHKGKIYYTSRLVATS